MNLPHQTRASLLARLSADVDRSVWLDFFEQYAELILGFAKTRGLQHSDCEDVLQNVLLSLVHAMKGFRYDPQRGSFRSYLLTITSRAVSQQLRQKRGEGALPGSGGDAPAPDAPSAGDAEAWELEWRRHHVRRAMRVVESEFSEENVQAFTAYVINGVPAQQVADSLGLSIEQVYQAKSRILKRLSATIERQRREED